MSVIWAQTAISLVPPPINFNINALGANFWQLTIAGLA